MPRGYALAALAALAASCLPPEDTCDYETGELELELAVTEENGAATGEAIFRADGVASLVLGDCGDAIEINGERLRAVSGTAKPIVYAAAVDEAEEYAFVFSRPEEGEYVSTVSGLRPAVTVTAPAAGSVITRDQGFDVLWDDNDDGEINLIVAGTCIRSYPDADGILIADDGADAIPANGLAWAGVEGTEAPTTCGAEVVLTRSVEGALDPALTGTLFGWTAGRAAFTSAPAPE